MMSDVTEKLQRHQADDLILLVGTNPLPNYVAGQLLCKPTGTIHLLCSSATEEIAQQLERKLSRSPLTFKVQVRSKLSESRPQEIFETVTEMVKGMKGRVGLHYTGGTKAMSVHAHRAAKKVCPEAICSYLDAHSLQLIVDGGMEDGRDDEIFVGKAISLTVGELAGLHRVTFTETRNEPFLLGVSRQLRADFETTKRWQPWIAENLRGADKSKFKAGPEMKEIQAPQIEFPEISAAFSELGASQNATLGEWATVSGFRANADGVKRFVEWLAGGYWLESIVLEALLHIKDACQLDDCGMGYVASEGKFEFDVAATRGYQLFAISCTTDDTNNLCKSKLFEAYARARQMGGDEARTALVCYHRDPDDLLHKFKSENYFAEGSVKIFGAPQMQSLGAYLKQWIENDSTRSAR